MVLFGLLLEKKGKKNHQTVITEVTFELCHVRKNADEKARKASVRTYMKTVYGVHLPQPISR